MIAIRALTISLLALALGVAQDPPRTVPGGLLITEVKGAQPDPPLFFAATAEATAHLNRKQIVQEILLKIEILQGKPEVVTLALQGDGEVISVAGEHVHYWAVRQGTGEETGKRYLEVRPKWSGPDNPLVSFEATVQTKQVLQESPGEATLLTLGPGDAVGFSGRLDLSPDETITARVTTRSGWVPVDLEDPATRQQRFQTTGSNSLQLLLEPRGAGAQPVSLAQVKLHGALADPPTSASFTLTANATVRDAGGAKLRVLAGQAALRELPADQPYRVQLVAHGSGAPYYELQFSGAGEFPIEIAFDARIATTDEWRSFDFSVPASAIVPMTLTGVSNDVQFDGSQPVFPTSTADGWLGFLPPSGRCAAAWKPGRDDAEGKLFFATNEETEISVSAGLLRQSATVHLNVLQGKLNELSIMLDGVGEILAVDGENVLGWNVTDADDGKRLLSIPVSRPFEGQSHVVIRSQTPVGEFPVQVKPIRLAPQGTVRHSGSLRVGNQGAVRIELGSIQGMTQLSPNQYPGQVSLTNEATQVFVYRIPSANYDYEILADQIMPELSLSQIAIYEMGETDRTIDAALELDIREAPLREWEIRIPEDYAVVSVYGADVADHVLGSLAENGSKPLKVLFGKMISGRHVVNVRLEKNQAPAAGDWVLPVLSYPDAKSVRGHVGVTATAGYRITTGAVDKLSELPLSQFPSQQRPLQQAYRLREPDWTATMTVEALGQSIQADVFHLYSLKEGMVYGSVLLNYFVVGAPVSEWRLNVPADVGNLAIDGQDVQGWRQEANIVTITLHQPALGPSTLLLTFEQPMAAEGGVLQPGAVTPLDVQGERGFVQVVSPYQVRYEVTQASAGLTRLEASEVPTEFQLLTRAPSLAVFQYSARPFELSMNVQWFEPGETADQIIDYARLYSQIARDGQVATEARFHVKSRGRQALRLRLPAEVTLWDAQVAGKPVNARADGEFTVIPLAGTPDPNQLVEILVRMGQAGQDPSRPIIVAPAADAPIMISEWRVRSDHGRLLVPTGVSKAQLSQGRLTETGFEWLRRWWPGCVIIVACGVIAWCLLRSPKNRVRPILAMILILAAILLGCYSTISALEHRTPNSQTLEIVAPVVTPNQPLNLTLRHVPTWQAMVVWNGVWAVCLGVLVYLAGHFVPKAPRSMTALVGGVLIAYGLLAQHLGAPLFFTTLTVGLLVPFLFKGWRLWREMCQAHRKQKAAKKASVSAEPPPAPEPPTADSGATTSALLAAGLSGALLLGFAPDSNANELIASAMQPPIITADQLSQDWRIEKQRLFAEMEFQITGEAGDWFPLLQSPAVLTSFSPNQQEGLRVTKRSREGAVDYWLVLENTGTFTAKATFEASVRDPRAAIPIPTGRAAVHRLRVQFDQAGWQVHSPAAVRTEELDAADSASGAELLLGAVGEMSIHLQAKSRDLTAEDSQFYAEVSNLFVPRPGVVDGVHQVAIRPSQGRVRDLELSVPEGFTVSDVLAEGVNRWRFDPESRLLRVGFETALAEPFRATVLTQQGTGSLPVSVALQPLRVQGAAGEVGMLGLAFGPDAQPDTVTATNLSAVNLEDFDASLLGNQKGEERLVLHRVYRYGAEAGNLAVNVVPVQPEIRVTTRQTLSLGEERLLLAVDLIAAVKRAGVFQLRFPVPAGVDIEAISGSHLDHWSEVTEDAQRLVVLHLKGRSLGNLKFAISLAGAAPGPQAAWVVPRFTVEGASRATGQLGISPELGIRLQAVSRRNVSQLDVRQLAGKQPGTMAYRLLQDDWELQLRIEKLEPWVTANALQEVTLREGQTRTRLAIAYQIENAAVKTLQVSLPGLTDDEEKTVHATGDAISDIVRVPVQEDMWQISFQRGMLGKLMVVINYQKPSDLSDSSETISPAALVDVRQATHWLAVRGADRLDLSANNPDRRWQAVDWSGVPRELQNSRDPSVPAISVRAIAPDQPLLVNVTRHEVAEALKLRVASGMLMSILSSQGETATKASLTIDVAERSPLRVTLPASAELLNVFVNGQSVALVRENDAYLFHVFPKEDSPLADVSFAYAIYGQQSLSALALSGPRLSIPLQNITWQVVLPNGYTLSKASGDLDLQQQGRFVRFDREQYLSGHSQRRSKSVQDANALLKKANEWRQQGRQSKAQEALYNASNTFSLDAASSEDARVQLRQLQTEQAVLGLNTRRQLLVTENRIDMPQFAERNEQLEQATNLNPFLKGETDYKPDQVDDLLQGNTVEENSALKRMAARLVGQQLAAEPALRGIDVTLPARGQLLTFQRSVQVNGNEALALQLKVAPARRVPWWMGLVVCLSAGLLAWVASARFGSRAS